MDDSTMDLLKSLNEIIFPSRCLSCSTLGDSMCPACRLIWSHQSHVQRLTKDNGKKLVVISSVLYSPTASRILLAAKESHIKRADSLIIGALDYAMQDFMSRNKSCNNLGLVPIPSRPQANRLRGRDFLYSLTHALSEKYQIPVRPILGYSRRVRDQSKLNSRQRWNNLNGSLVLIKDISPQESRGLILIDDLVTTGATLLAAESALNHAGIQAVGAVTACVAQPLR